MIYKISRPFGLLPRLAAIASLLLAMVTCLIPGPARVWAQDVAPNEVDERRIGPYRIEIRTVLTELAEADREYDSTIRIWRNGKLVFHRNRSFGIPVLYEFAHAQHGTTQWMFDHFATKDRSPLADAERGLVIAVEYPSAHCCSSGLIFLLQPQFKFLGELRNVFWWKRDANEPVEADLLVLDTLDMPSPIPAQLYCEVNLRVRQGALHIDQNLQRRPPYSARFLKKLVARVRDPARWGWAGGSVIDDENPELIGFMMTLVYSGNIDQPRRLLDLAWHPDIPGKAEWSTQFWARLRESPYWADLEALTRSPIARDADKPGEDFKPICYDAGAE